MLLLRFMLSEKGGSGWGGIAVMVLSVFISFFLHIILHEGGHLVCGLLSGYRFVSYRAGSIIWVKQGKQIVRKKFSIPGTGGQCLLDPPEPEEDGSFPSLLYNLGGGLSNLLFCLCRDFGAGSVGGKRQSTHGGTGTFYCIRNLSWCN